MANQNLIELEVFQEIRIRSVKFHRCLDLTMIQKLQCAFADNTSQLCIMTTKHAAKNTNRNLSRFNVFESNPHVRVGFIVILSGFLLIHVRQVANFNDAQHKRRHSLRPNLGAAFGAAARKTIQQQKDGDKPEFAFTTIL